MKTLKELADLSTVINQVKTTMNTAGHARFSKDTMSKLRNILARLEQNFVNDVINLNLEVEMKEVHLQIDEARKQIAPPKGDGAVVTMEKGLTVVTPEVKPESEPVVEPAVEPEAKKAEVKRAEPTELTEAQRVMAEISSRLTEEKKKLAAKGKRKALPVKTGKVDE